jgi:hypothetical protein
VVLVVDGVVVAVVVVSAGAVGVVGVVAVAVGGDVRPACAEEVLDVDEEPPHADSARAQTDTSRALRLIEVVFAVRVAGSF